MPRLMTIWIEPCPSFPCSSLDIIIIFFPSFAAVLLCFFLLSSFGHSFVLSFVHSFFCFFLLSFAYSSFFSFILSFFFLVCISLSFVLLRILPFSYLSF